MFQRACYYSLLLSSSSAATRLLLFTLVNLHSFTDILPFCSATLARPCACSLQFLVWQSLFLFTVSSVAGMVAACGAVQTKTLLQFNFSSSRMECFPSLPSPPPIRRASLPLSLSFNPRNHIVPLMLDTPDSECSLSSQENGSREAFTYSIQNQG